MGTVFLYKVIFIVTYQSNNLKKLVVLLIHLQQLFSVNDNALKENHNIQKVRPSKMGAPDEGLEPSTTGLKVLRSTKLS